MMLKAKDYSIAVLNKRRYVYIFKKKLYCVTWKKRRDSLLIGVKEIDEKFKSFKNIVNENIIKQRIC